MSFILEEALFLALIERWSTILMVSACFNFFPSQLTWPCCTLYHLLCQTSPSNQCYPPYPTLFLARIIFTLTRDHISLLLEAPLALTVHKKKCQSYWLAWSYFCYFTLVRSPPYHLHPSKPNMFHLLWPFWVELVLSSLSPSHT